MHQALSADDSTDHRDRLHHVLLRRSGWDSLISCPVVLTWPHSFLASSLSSPESFFLWFCWWIIWLYIEKQWCNWFTLRQLNIVVIFRWSRSLLQAGVADMVWCSINENRMWAKDPCHHSFFFNCVEHWLCGVFTHTASPTLEIPGSACSCGGVTLVPFMRAWYECIELVSKMWQMKHL